MPPPEDKPQIPSAKEISELPRWARVAFAARCARRVQPVFQASWPSAPQKHVDAIDRAIRVAEASAARGTARAVRAVRAAAARVRAAAARVTAAHAAHDARVAHAADDAARFAYAAAYAAANAAAAAYAVVDAAYDAVDAAATIVRTASPIMCDFELLKTLTMERSWTDDTPVPPSIFGPMWPDGAPEGWPEYEEAPEAWRVMGDTFKVSEVPEDNAATDDEQKNIFDDIEPLTLAIDPGSATPEEIAELLAEISKLYRMVGGSGINFRIADVWSLEGAVA